MKKILRRIFSWLFKEEIMELGKRIQEMKEIQANYDRHHREINKILSTIDVSVDVHSAKYRYSPSWAVISIQGERADFIKFFHMSDADAREIASFLRQFERARNIKIDAAPTLRDFFRMEHRKNSRY